MAKLQSMKGKRETHSAPKTKLCWNCEARVTHDQGNCPYCQVYLSPEEEPQFSSFESKSERLTPPYAIAEPSDPQVPPPSPFAGLHIPEQIESQEEPVAVKQTMLSEGFNEELRLLLSPLILLTAGMVCLFFGLMLFLFAKDGELVLRWNGTYWFVYLLVAIPLLGLGWRSFSRLDDL